MSFSNIKSFCKENWAAFVTLGLGFGQLILFIYMVQQAALWLEHSTSMDSTYLTNLGGIWIVTFTLSVAFPTIIISHQAYTIKKLQAEKKTTR